MTHAELEQVVGFDLAALVRLRALPVVAASSISPLGAPSGGRGAFRLELANGTAMKAHRVESVEAARRAVRLSGCLPRGPFPPIVDQHGCALLAPWIDGRALTERPASREQLRCAGAIQRSVHEAELSPAVPEARYSYPGAAWRHDLMSKLDGLGRLGLLDEAERVRALELALARVPPVLPVRLVHGDICPENIVVDGRGRLHVVDNEGVDVHAGEFDLARTWYRWPMSPCDREAYEAGYGDRETLSSFRQHFLHWTIVVLIGALDFRARAGVADVSLGLARLRDVLRREDSAFHYG